MKKSLMAIMLVGAFSSAPVMAQVSKKIMIGIGIAVGATAVGFTGASMSAVNQSNNGGNSESGGSDSGASSGPSESGASDSGQSDSQSNSKANLVQLEDNYYSYLQEFKLAKNEGAEFTLDDISQPYIKEIIVNILNNEELVAQINEEVEGNNLLDKINLLIAEELEILLSK